MQRLCLLGVRDQKFLPLKVWAAQRSFPPKRTVWSGQDKPKPTGNKPEKHSISQVEEVKVLLTGSAPDVL